MPGPIIAAIASKLGTALASKAGGDVASKIVPKVAETVASKAIDNTSTNPNVEADTNLEQPVSTVQKTAPQWTSPIPVSNSLTFQKMDPQLYSKQIGIFNQL